MQSEATFERRLTADRGDAGCRLDRVLRRHLHELKVASRTRVQRWIEDGRVAINGLTVRRVAARTALGDVVSIRLPADAEPLRRRPAPEDLPLDVLFEDDHLLVVNKPPGIVAHPAYRHTRGTLLNALLWHARRWPAPERPSLLGRLDRQTSGLVVVARTAAVHAALQRELASMRASKIYLAVVYGHVHPRRGTVREALARDPHDRRKVVVSTSGTASVTNFERVAQCAAPSIGISLVQCRLLTGRMHQIRVHLAFSGWPIVGDATYGEPQWAAIRDPKLAAALRAFPRQALHAWRVAVTHPVTGRMLEVEAPLPPDLQGLLAVTSLSLV